MDWGGTPHVRGYPLAAAMVDSYCSSFFSQLSQIQPPWTGVQPLHSHSARAVLVPVSIRIPKMMAGVIFRRLMNLTSCLIVINWLNFDTAYSSSRSLQPWQTQTLPLKKQSLQSLSALITKPVFAWAETMAHSVNELPTRRPPATNIAAA